MQLFMAVKTNSPYNMKRTPLAGLLLLTATFTVLTVTMSYYGIYYATRIDTVWIYGFPVCIAWWVHKDRFYIKKDAPYEYLAFMYFAWILLLPWYLIKSRGWKGVFIYSGFYCLSELPYLVDEAVVALELFPSEYY
jgi:hypothetical protein